MLSLIIPTTNANEFDQRQVLLLNQEQQVQVLSEMRSLLFGTQSIVAAKAAYNMKAVAKHARTLGMVVKKSRK